LCRIDLHVVGGQRAVRTNVALPLGHENTGWIREVGGAVDHLAPGDTVILHPLATRGFCPACRAGDDVHCADSGFPGIDTDCGMAELLRTSARSVVKLAHGTQPADGAALADADLTAYHAVQKEAPQLFSGSTHVVMGAGRLGHIGIQCVWALTATRVVVLDPNEAALALAASWGAHEPIRVDGGHVPRLLKLIDGNGLEVVLDFVGERGAEADSWAMIGQSGSHYVIGYGGTITVPTIDASYTERNVVGNLVGSYSELSELMALAQSGEVTLHTRSYPLDAVNDAVVDLDSDRPSGRAILVPASHRTG
jgi:NAD+-dependent secondary alcohol dehydrogenase Adh1